MGIRGVIFDLIGGLLGEFEPSMFFGRSEQWLKEYTPTNFTDHQIPRLVHGLAARGLLIGIETSLTGRQASYLTFECSISFDALVSCEHSGLIRDRLEVFARTWKLHPHEILYVTSDRSNRFTAHKEGYLISELYGSPKVLEIPEPIIAEVAGRCTVTQELLHAFTGNPHSGYVHIATPKIPASFLTLHEIRWRHPRWFEIQVLLLNEFPVETLRDGHNTFLPFHPNNMVRYKGKQVGEATLRRLKNWGFQGNTSGPNPDFFDLDFIAVAMTASLQKSDFDVVVPTPASPWSNEKPGQISVRLASRIAQLLGAPIWFGLERIDHGDIRVKDRTLPIRGKNVLLVDDQLTLGKTMQSSLAALHNHKPDLNVRTVSWSASNRRFEK